MNPILFNPEVRMIAQLFTVMSILLVLVSACNLVEATDVLEVMIEPATEVSSVEVIKEELRPIMRVMVSGSMTDRLALLQYTRTPCANIEGLGGPPRCPDGVEEGTIVEVFPMLGSEGSFVKPEEMENVLSNTLVKNLHAVYVVTAGPNDEPFYPTGDYAMLFERDLNDYPLPIVLHVTNGKIVRMDLHTGVSAADMLKKIPLEQIAITPREAKAWMEKD